MGMCLIVNAMCLKGQYPKSYENVQVLLGGKTEFGVSLYLPGNKYLRAIREHLGPLNLKLSDSLSHTALKHSEGYGGQVFFLDREVKKGWLRNKFRHTGET